MERLPDAALAQMLGANLTSATEFEAFIRRGLPRGTPEDGHLVDTLQLRRGKESRTAILVSIGDAEQTHILHREAGHRNADGSHTPAKPLWYPALRVLKKRHRKRASDALKRVVAIVSGSGG
jgi:hypothetical protein